MFVDAVDRRPAPLERLERGGEEDASAPAAAPRRDRTAALDSSVAGHQAIEVGDRLVAPAQLVVERQDLADEPGTQVERRLGAGGVRRVRRSAQQHFAIERGQRRRRAGHPLAQPRVELVARHDVRQRAHAMRRSRTARQTAPGSRSSAAAPPPRCATGTMTAQSRAAAGSAGRQSTMARWNARRSAARISRVVRGVITVSAAPSAELCRVFSSSTARSSSISAPAAAADGLPRDAHVARRDRRAAPRRRRATRAGSRSSAGRAPSLAFGRARRPRRAASAARAVARGEAHRAATRDGPASRRISSSAPRETRISVERLGDRARGSGASSSARAAQLSRASRSRRAASSFAVEHRQQRRHLLRPALPEAIVLASARRITRSTPVTSAARA